MMNESFISGVIIVAMHCRVPRSKIQKAIPISMLSPIDNMVYLCDPPIPNVARS
jgi:hypothetical protein